MVSHGDSQRQTEKVSDAKQMMLRAAIDSFDRWASYSVEFNPLLFTEVSVCLFQLFQYYWLENTDETQKRWSKAFVAVMKVRKWNAPLPSYRSDIDGWSTCCPSSCPLLSVTCTHRETNFTPYTYQMPDRIHTSHWQHLKHFKNRFL